METKHLKKYAPEARREFIEAVKNKAAVYGLLPKEILPMKEEGDVVIIGDRPFPRSVAKQRKELEARIRKEGFQQFIEAIAYTWFNRFVAIRYMELHGYLDHGYRVLSHPEGKSAPEILENAERIELPGLKRDEVVDLKLDGGKDEQLYQLLLLAQCNALHKAMPFLFESIKDGTELLLPDNLLHTDSLVRTLVNNIPEEQWENVEIIGWLYQFYISEKKDKVIGKVVKSEDIPAATQLFTPNWIVKYLVQNSLGRQWVTTYPASPLKQQMEFYIEPAEQTAEVQQQLDEITPDSLNPEELTLLDPACGSGHILVEAYDLFKAIYEERGYRPRDIPKLILTKNLYGLEIDDRAAQLAAFALMMKARADDRGIFGRGVQPNVLSIQESKGLDANELYFTLISPMKSEKSSEVEPVAPDGHLFQPDDNLFTRAESAASSQTQIKAGFSQSDLGSILKLFEEAKTLGSLVQIPPQLSGKIKEIEERLEDVLKNGDLTHASVRVLKPFLRQARLLEQTYDVVAANPPYMGSRSGMNSALKGFVNELFPQSKSDLYSIFIERNLQLAKKHGYVGMVTMHGWMFLSTFEGLREKLLDQRTLLSLAHLGPRAFGSISGEVVQVSAFLLSKIGTAKYRPKFFRLVDGEEATKKAELISQKNPYTEITLEDFKKLPSAPLAYWASRKVIDAFQSNPPIESFATFKQGMATSDNDRFLRLWHEIGITSMDMSCKSPLDLKNSKAKWFPYNKGGSYRKWYGNNEYVVNWANDGKEMKDFTATLPQGTWVRLKSREFYCLPNITYSALSSGSFGCRLSEAGFLFDTKGSCIFAENENTLASLSALLNSTACQTFLNILCPTLDYSMVGVKKIPAILSSESSLIAQEACSIAKTDWDLSEESWDFHTSPIINTAEKLVSESYECFEMQCKDRFARIGKLEEKNNRIFIEAFGLQEELSPEVPDDQITLYRPDQEEDIKRLLSYAIGCMMGRYSLDEPGLIYAHSGNEGFDPSKYTTFPADDDGIIPITDVAWFSDDAANRSEQFIKTAWPVEHLEENLTFVADSLGQKKGETPRDCIRRYLATGFYKHHLSMYKKRPIYWLFSSGKQRAFQCLVYLHRYNAGTLSRMRTEYVVPLQGKMNARIEQLESDIPAANSTSHRKKLEKERDTLIKQREELQTFDEKLRHYADQRIELDLDDGVKVNYGKFGDLLAEVKAITGEKPKVEVNA